MARWCVRASCFPAVQVIRERNAAKEDVPPEEKGQDVPPQQEDAPAQNEGEKEQASPPAVPEE